MGRELRELGQNFFGLLHNGCCVLTLTRRFGVPARGPRVVLNKGFETCGSLTSACSSKISAPGNFDSMNWSN